MLLRESGGAVKKHWRQKPDRRRVRYTNLAEFFSPLYIIEEDGRGAIERSNGVSQVALLLLLLPAPFPIRITDQLLKERERTTYTRPHALNMAHTAPEAGPGFILVPSRNPIRI